MDARLLHSREFSKKILDDTKITGSNFCIKGLGVEKLRFESSWFSYPQILPALAKLIPSQKLEKSLKP